MKGRGGVWRLQLGPGTLKLAEPNGPGELVVGGCQKSWRYIVLAGSWWDVPARRWWGWGWGT